MKTETDYHYNKIYCKGKVDKIREMFLQFWPCSNYENFCNLAQFSSMVKYLVKV